VAVLLSIEEYRRLVAGKKSFWDAYSEFRDRVDPGRPEIFGWLRDASPGREAGSGWKSRSSMPICWRILLVGIDTLMSAKNEDASARGVTPFVYSPGMVQ
jgi:hypothetical protein